MSAKTKDGSAGDVNYGQIGATYTQYRRPDPRIARHIHESLGAAITVLNVGAGAGSYEPRDRRVVAVEPSASMRTQRPPELAAAIDARAEKLPFANDQFDAAMATFTVHQWKDLGAGLREIRRVTRGPVAVLTCDPAAVQQFWLNEYAPAVLAAEARRYPPVAAIADALGGSTTILPVPIPLDCCDGFNEAYYGRPAGLLEAGARLACSAWSFIEPAVTAVYVAHLRQDLAGGTWDRQFGYLRTQPWFDGSLRLIVAHGKS
jgi:SAM-dependent methyltransferase